MTRRIACLFLCGFFLVPTGCKDAKRDAETSQFATLYVKLRMAASGLEGQPEKAQEARRNVLRASGSDLVSYRKRLRDLQTDPDRWEAFWTRVQFLADSLEKKTKKKGS